MKLTRRIGAKRVAVAALVLGMLGAAPVAAHHVRRIPPAFYLSAPEDKLVSDTATLRWRWRGDSAMRRRSVSLSTIAPDGTISIISLATPIWHGRATWDTTTWADGVYQVRGMIVGMTLRSTVTDVVVDNTAPTVAITKPAPGDAQADATGSLMVELESFELPATVVAGVSRLAAEASDALSGVKTVEWYVDGRFVGEGLEIRYDFGAVPGERQVTVRAVDHAGNEATDSRTVMAVGTTAPSEPPSAPSVELPGGDEEPQAPDAAPSVPGLPEVPGLPPVEAPALPADPATLPALD